MHLFVFDVFGTLIDGHGAVPEPGEIERFLGDRLGLGATAARAVTAELVEAVATALLVPASPQPATTDLLVAALARVGVTVTAPAAVDHLWAMLGAAEHYTARPGAIELVGGLRDAGYEVRALSNCILPGRLMDRVLDRLGLDGLGRRVYSSDGRVKKPHPAAFEAVGEGRFAWRCMIGDSEVDDYLPAVRLGWDAILLDGALPGFDELVARVTGSD